ncbi:hypothetical protein JTI77_09245, partial [Vibrio furnissii]
PAHQTFGKGQLERVGPFCISIFMFKLFVLDFGTQACAIYRYQNTTHQQEILMQIFLTTKMHGMNF